MPKDNDEHQRNETAEAIREVANAIRHRASDEDRKLLMESLAKAARLAKRLKAVAKAMAELDAATPE